MKKLLISLAFCLFSYSSVYADQVVKDLYVYGGGGIGFGILNTDVVNDAADKDGGALSASLFGTYYEKHWIASLGFGYYDLTLESKSGANKVKLITETFYLDLRPEFRINHRWSAGLSYQQIVGEELLAAPSSQLNVDNESTTRSLAGAVLNYDIPWKKFRMRAGLSLHKGLSIGARDLWIPMLSFHIGAPIVDNTDENTKIVYKYRDREIIKLVPNEVIELGEQVINYRTGSAKLNKKSAAFIGELAKMLKNNLASWEIVRIVGHTDVIGSKENNQLLSERRAESVKNILIGEGIDRERVFFLGFGEERPKRKGATAEDHRINRRVEFQFIGRVDRQFADKVKAFVKKSSQVKSGS